MTSKVGKVSTALVGCGLFAAVLISGGNDPDVVAVGNLGQADAQQVSAMQISRVALDLVLPVDREGAGEARRAVQRAFWETLEPAWTECVGDAGHHVSSDIGREVSGYAFEAEYEFIAPSVILREAGSVYLYSEEVQTLSAEELRLAERCSDEIRGMVLDGGRTPERSVDQARLSAVRAVTEFVSSEVSLYGQPLQEQLTRAVQEGHWAPAAECLVDRGALDRPTDGPGSALDLVSARFGEIRTVMDRGNLSFSDAREQLAREARPALEAYIECSESFYDLLAERLGALREEHRLEYEQELIELSDALADLDLY